MFLGETVSSRSETNRSLGRTRASLDDDYKALITKPREAVVARKGVTTDIGDTEGAATELLETEVDKSMKKFETKNADFFGEYKNARMIIDLGAHTSDKKPVKPTSSPPAHP
jgi:hypothetical protein